jgi:hypothetical protein
MRDSFGQHITLSILTFAVDVELVVVSFSQAVEDLPVLSQVGIKGGDLCHLRKARDSGINAV